jgi:nucleotide-binding universal stress UspA family protein
MLAVGRATSLAQAHAARLHVVVAYDPRLPSEFAQAGDAPEEEAMGAERVAQDVVDRAVAAGISVQAHVEFGDAPSALIGVAEEVDAKLIVVGSKGLANDGRFLLGSVSSKVAQHAHCDVLIVRRP